MRQNFFKVFISVMLLMIFLGANNLFAQLTGVKNIPGDYATLADAIADLNTQGVGTGGVTFNVAANYTETITATLVITATGTLSDQIIFQKSGTGANPLITAYTGTSTPTSASQDGIWALVGSDYVTIDGIDLLDPNSTNPATMEYGFGLFKASTSDGCQNVTIKNCTVTLSRNNNASGSGPSVEGSKGINVVNATITAQTTALTPSSAAGSNSFNKFYSNTLQNCNYGIAINGFAASTGVGPNPDPGTFLGDLNNDIGGNTSLTGNVILNFGGAASATNPSAGIRVNFQWGVNISYNIINNNNGSGVNHPSTLRGIFAQAGTSGNATINNNTIIVQSGALTSACTAIDNGIGATAASNTIIINSNQIQIGYPTASSGVYTAINNSASATNVIINSNNITQIAGVALAGTGTHVMIETGSPVNATTSNNIIQNITRNGASGSWRGIKTTSPTNWTCNGNLIENISWSLLTSTGGFEGIYSFSSAVNVTANNNIIRNISTPTTGTVIGIREFGVSGTKIFQNNQIYNFSTTAGGAGGATFTGFLCSTGNIEVSNNQVYNLNSTGTTGGTGGTIYGVQISGGTTNNIFRNNIYNLSTNSTNPAVAGLLISSGTTNYAHNNFISDLKAPNLNAANSLLGISVTGGTTVGLYYNTIYLNATSAGALFGSSGISASTTPTLDMRNNIIVNLSTPNGATGYTSAFRRSGVSLTTYSANSNANAFYAGTPGTNNLIFFDGTNSDQTIAGFKARVAPRDAISFSENVPFVNSTTAPYDLHVNTTVPTQTESGGIPVSSPITITTDFDGDLRNATTPDVGADEFNGTLLDLSPPTISYTPLQNTGSTSVRTLVASVSDPSGVPTSGIGLPVLYWKIGVEGTYTGSTATYLSGSNYQFSFGSGVALGDTVFYFVAAQDNATTPNTGVFPSAGASGFSANPPAASTPPTNPSSYIITQPGLSGDLTIGATMFKQLTGKNIYFEKVVNRVMKEVWVESPEIEKSRTDLTVNTLPFSERGSYQLIEVEEESWIPMENGLPYTGELYVKRALNPEIVFPEGIDATYLTITAAIADLNLRGVSGNTNFILVDATYPSETFPILVDINNSNQPNSSATVTLKPASGVAAVITGSNASAIFKLNGVDYFTIDGLNTSGSSLTIENTNTSGSAVIWIGSKSSTDGSTNNAVRNCTIRGGGSPGAQTIAGILCGSGTTVGGAAESPNSNLTIQGNTFSKIQNGIYLQGNPTTYDDNIQIIFNTFGSTVNADKLSFRGMLIGNIQNSIVSQNTITGVLSSSSSTSTMTGIQLAFGLTNVSITRNKISDIKQINTGGWGSNGIFGSTSLPSTNVLIANNFISDVASQGFAGNGAADNGYGIMLSSGTDYKIYFNSINLATNQISATGLPAAINIASTITTAGTLDIRNNIFAIPATVGTNRYAIYSGAANTVFSFINYNDYYTTGPNLGFLVSNRADLNAWQTATGQDANSLSADPKFVSATDLHIDPLFNVVSNNGFYLASVPIDIDGDTRNNPPDIGADEYTYIPPSVADPVSLAADASSGTQINVTFELNAANNNIVIVWNNTGTFDAPASAPPVVGQPFAGGTLLYNGVVSPVSHSGLNPLTAYYYKAFSYDGTNYSPGINANATTWGAFPYTQDFEGTFVPTGWQNYGDKLWTQTNTGGVGGSKAARVSYLPAGTANLQTPVFVLPSSPNYRAVFSWRDNDIAAVEGETKDGKEIINPEIINHDTTYFEITTDGGANWMILSFLSAVSPQPAYVTETVNLAAYAGQTVSFRWRDVSNGSSSAYGTGLDDVKFEEVPSCIEPSALTATGITNISAVLSWTENGTATSWDIEYGVTPFTPTGIPTLSGVTNPYNLGGLTSSTSYAYYVRSNCGSGNFSAWVGPYNFSTLCDVVGIPFNESFDAVTFPPQCWTRITLSGNQWIRSTVTPYAGPGVMRYNFSSTQSANAWMITPGIQLQGGTKYNVKFWQKVESGAYPENLKVTVGTDATVAAQTTTIWDGPDLINSTYIERVAEFTPATTGAYYFGFNAYSDADQWNLYVDEISIVEAPSNDIGIAGFYQDTGSTLEAVVQTGLSRELSADQSFEDAYKQRSIVVSMIQSSSNFTEAGPADFKVLVQNFGAVVENSYQIGWQVNGIAQPSISNTQPLAVGAIDTLTLTWATPEAGLHTARAWTILGTDVNPSNDSSAVYNFYVAPTNSVFLERFNGATPPAGWDTVNVDGGGTTLPWFAGNSGVFPALEGFGYIAANYNGANGFYIDQWLITPNTGGIVENSVVDSLVFWMRSPTQTIYYPDSVQFLVSTTGTDIADFTLVLDYVQIPQTWTRYAYALPNATNRYVAFRYLHFDGGPTGGASNYIGLDLVEIQRHSSGPATFQLSVDIATGWNMVSVPGLHPTDQNVNTWWAGKDPAAGVFRFSGGYQAVTTVAPGTGYWMKHVGATTYNTGDEWPAGGIQIVPNDPIPAVTGWNLIGGYHNTVATAGLTTTPSGLISGQVFGYIPGSGYAPATNLTPGYGYWIKLSGAGNINIPGSLAKSAPVTEYIKSDWGRIILTDASGKSYILYSVDGEVDLTQYELPPLPPAGMFDVRYGSQRLAEVIGSEIQTIEMQGIEYPVTVRVEGMTIRLQDETGKIVNQVLKSGEDVVISNPQVGKLKVSSNVIPETYSLEQNYPNPFNPSTTIEFSIPEDVENVKLTIYDALGQKVVELVNGKLEAGRYSYQWDASKLASGLYIYQLQTSKFTSTKKMLMLK